MAFNSYKDEARKDWGCTDRKPDTDELKIGALQRIADATEVMAREYSRLIEQRNIYEEWWRKSKAYSERLERRNAALRGQITKLRKRVEAGDA